MVRRPQQPAAAASAPHQHGYERGPVLLVLVGDGARSRKHFGCALPARLAEVLGYLVWEMEETCYFSGTSFQTLAYHRKKVSPKKRGVENM